MDLMALLRLTSHLGPMQVTAHAVYVAPGGCREELLSSILHLSRPSPNCSPSFPSVAWHLTSTHSRHPLDRALSSVLHPSAPIERYEWPESNL